VLLEPLSYQKYFQNQIWCGSGVCVCVGAGKREKKETKRTQHWVHQK